jgi:hypothetical protein
VVGVGGVGDVVGVVGVGVWGCVGVWVWGCGGGFPLRSNIPRSALCATLDTYNFSVGQDRIRWIGVSGASVCRQSLHLGSKEGLDFFAWYINQHIHNLILDNHMYTETNSPSKAIRVGPSKLFLMIKEMAEIALFPLRNPHYSLIGPTQRASFSFKKHGQNSFPITDIVEEKRYFLMAW